MNGVPVGYIPADQAVLLLGAIIIGGMILIAVIGWLFEDYFR